MSRIFMHPGFMDAKGASLQPAIQLKKAG